MGGSASTPVSQTVPEPEPFADYAAVEGEMWTMDGTANKPPILAESGIGAVASATLNDMFLACVKNCGDKAAFKVERPCPVYDKETPMVSLPKGQWKTWTFTEYYDQSVQFGKACMAGGLEKHDSVIIYGFNSPEFIISMMGASIVGGKFAGIYSTDTPEQVSYKTVHSGASIVSVETSAKAKVFQENLDAIPYLKTIVVWFDTPEVDSFSRSDGSAVRVIGWEEFLKSSDATSDEQLKERMDGVQPGECAALIYTSGTTGQPKAVMISHDSLVFTASSVLKSIPELQGPKDQHRVLSYLPLSHVAGLLLDVISAIKLGAAGKGASSSLWFARKYDLSTGGLKYRLQTVEPTLFLGVPRVWEKIAEAIVAAAPKGGLVKKAGLWAKKTTLKYQLNCQLGGSGKKPPNLGLAMDKILIKVKRNLGLTKMQFGLTGAAPIARNTLEFFGSLGLQVNEVYGMSESCGTTTVCSNRCHLWGAVGYAIPGAEVRVFKVNPDDINDKEPCPDAKDMFTPDEESQGELCFRGRHIMMGYLAQPTLGEEHMAAIAKKNREAIDNEGWLHSGDKGCIWKGMVRVTGRYKDIIIGAGGENVAPVPIENRIKKLCPAISGIMMLGDKRKFNVAIVTLKAFGSTGEEPGSDKLDGPARKVNPKITTITEARADEVFTKHIMDAIVEANKTAPNNASKIQRFTIYPHDFSVATGELTPTLKLKRSAVASRHEAMIDLVYAAERGIDYVPWQGGDVDPAHDVSGHPESVVPADNKADEHEEVAADLHDLEGADEGASKKADEEEPAASVKEEEPAASDKEEEPAASKEEELVADKEGDQDEDAAEE